MGIANEERTKKMRNVFVVAAIFTTLGLIGCASTPRDLSQLQANVDTASEGDFGRCMEAVYAGAMELQTARDVLSKAEKNNGEIGQHWYDKGLQASENAVREREAAEKACYGRLTVVEQRIQRIREVLTGVTFVEGSATLTQGAKETLDVVANRLLREPTRVEVQGHTSSTGSLELNMRLSQQRAESVRSYLISQGVQADSITATGYGPEQPVASNDTPEGRRANQRVELQFQQEIQ